MAELYWAYIYTTFGLESFSYNEMYNVLGRVLNVLKHGNVFVVLKYKFLSLVVHWNGGVILITHQIPIFYLIQY